MEKSGIIDFYILSFNTAWSSRNRCVREIILSERVLNLIWKWTGLLFFYNFEFERDVSSAGLERMLDRHEVGSSTLPRPTNWAFR